MLRQKQKLWAWGAAALVLSLACVAPAQAVTSVVAPGAADGVEGNNNNGFPFNLPGVLQSAMRYQQVYEASNFASLSGPSLLTGIAFRADENHGAAFGPVLFSGYTIKFSTTAANTSTLSTTYASNIGPDETTVLSSDFTISGSNPAGSPNPFDIVIDFTTPFLYDPSAGNLLMEVIALQGFSTTQFDAVTETDSVARVFNTNNDPFAATGRVDTLGLVTQLRFESEAVTAVPEPATAAMSLLAVVGLIGAATRRRAGASDNV